MNIQALRGMQDLLPEQKEIFRFIEAKARQVFECYGYQEMGMPVLEATHLFKRAVGDGTDLIEKEMYTFDDRNGDSITLRPEGTAGCIRVAEQHGLLFNQIQRLWYHGPMFRYERPQKGRYRQFEQIGVECFGMPGADIDAEILLLCARLWRELGIDKDITLELNSLGSAEARVKYRTVLVEYLTSVKDQLDEDSQRRITSNPLRVFDSKVPQTQQLLRHAPLLKDYLDDESKQHFQQLCEQLDKCDIAYQLNPYIVRGLDYYNRTVFEWVTSSLGAQGTVCAGGRYDGLVAQIGGKGTPGVGFALGLDRIALMLQAKFEHANAADIYVVSNGEGARQQALWVAENVRNALPQRKIVVHCGAGKFKAQLKRADASEAKLALILGETEVTNGTIGVKFLRDDREQISVNVADLNDILNRFFS